MQQDHENRPPGQAGWRWMFVLANVPAAVLLGWLLLAAAGWGPVASSTACLVVSGLGVAASVAGTLLLRRNVGEALAGLERSLDESTLRQAHLRAVFDTAGDAILTFDREGRVISANRAAGRLFGWAEGEFAGLPLGKLLPGAPLDEPGTNEHRLLGAADSARGCRKDGTLFPVAVDISKVRVEGRAVFLAVIQDLTALAAARERAEQAGRGRSAFLLSMSHELRTPLNGILGMASALRETALAAEQMRLLARLEQSGEALLSLVERLVGGPEGDPRPPRPASERPVLLVLGDAAERRALEDALRARGMAPTGVPTGRAALAEVVRGVVQGEPFGLVVLEARLPDLGAEDWLHQLAAASGWDGPVLMLHDGSGLPAPARVAATLHRRDARESLAELAGRHYPEAC